MAGKTKLTVEKIRKEFFDVGYILQDVSELGCMVKYPFICDRGHHHEIKLRDLRIGVRCKYCSNGIVYNLDEAKQKYLGYGFELLDDTFENAGQKLNCKCVNGHVIKISLHDLKSGYGCKYCSGCAKYEYDDVKVIIENEGYQLLSKSYLNANKPLIVSCPNNHIYKVRWADFRRGCRCQKCYFNSNTRSNHWNYNDNLTDDERVARRYDSDLVKWRRQVRKRDNDTCQCCQSKKSPEAHHIYGYAIAPALRYELSNGVTLCESCHIEFHRKYGYKWFGEDDLIEFMQGKK